MKQQKVYKAIGAVVKLLEKHLQARPEYHLVDNLTTEKLTSNLEELKTVILSSNQSYLIQCDSKPLLSTFLIKVFLTFYQKDYEIDTNGKESQKIIFYINLDWHLHFKTTNLPLSILLNKVYNVDISDLIKQGFDITLVVEGSQFHSFKTYTRFLLESKKFISQGVQFICGQNLFNENIELENFKYYRFEANLNPSVFLKDRLHVNQESTLNITKKDYSNITYLRSQLEENYSKGSFHHFLILHMLPYVAYEFYQKKWNSCTLPDLEAIFQRAALYFYTIHYATAFPYLKDYLSDLAPDNLFTDNSIITGLIDQLFNIQHFLVCESFIFQDEFNQKTNTTIFFRDRFCRDFFYSWYIYNTLQVSLIANQDLPKIFKSRPLTKNELLLLGQLLKEGAYKPYLTNEGIWKLKQGSEDTLIMQLLNYCRGVFNQKYLGWINWNIINLLILSRKELSGLNLSNLDFYGINLKHIVCSRKDKNGYLATNFEYAKLYSHNFRENIDFIPSKITNLKDSLLLFDQRKRQFALIDNQSGHTHYKVDYNPTEKFYIIPFSQSELLFKTDNNSFILWDIEESKVIYETKIPISFLHFFHLDPSSNRILLGDKYGNLLQIDLKEKTVKENKYNFIAKINFALDNRLNGDLLFGLSSGDIIVRQLGEFNYFLGHTASVETLCPILDRYLVSADKDGKVLLWDYQTQQCIKRIGEFTKGIAGIFFIVDSKTLVIIDKKGLILFFEIKNFTHFAQFNIGGTLDSTIETVAYHSKEKIYISTKENLYIYNLFESTIQDLTHFTLKKSKKSLYLHQDEQKFLITHEQECIKEYKIIEDKVKCINALKLDRDVDLATTAFYGKIESEKIVAISKKGTFLEEEESGKLSEFGQFNFITTGSKHSFQGNRVLVLNRKGKGYLLDTETIRVVQEISISSNIQQVILHPKENKILIAADAFRVVEWDLDTNSQWQTYPLLNAKISQIGYLDNDIFVLTKGGKLFLFNRLQETLSGEKQFLTYQNSETIGSPRIQKQVPFLKKSLLFDYLDGVFKKGMKYDVIRTETNQDFTIYFYQFDWISVTSNSKGNTIFSFRDNSNLFICGCNMQHINPTSEIDFEKDISFLEAQGAIISEGYLNNTDLIVNNDNNR